MKKVVFRFNFFEDNFYSERKYFYLILKYIRKNSINVVFLKDFPPCIIDIKSNPSKDVIYLDAKNIVITNNLYFGREFQEINHHVKNQEFVLDSCKVCNFYEENLCRGIFNNKFTKQKEKIMCKIGKKNYEAIEEDYKDGNFIFGSFCSKKCKFCFNENAPVKMTKKISRISFREIKHFIQYTSKKYIFVASGRHCANGELIERDDFEDIIKLILPLQDNPSVIFTEGTRFNEEKLSIIKKYDLYLAISLTSLNDNIRLKYIQYKDNCRIKKVLKELDEIKIRYMCFILPLKSTLQSGDLKNTIEYLTNNSNCTNIFIHKPGYSNLTKEEIRQELDFDHSKTLSLLKEINSSKTVPDYLINENLVKDSIKKILDIKRKNRKTLLLCPENTFEYFSKFFSKEEVVKVTSEIGFNFPSAGLLTFKDYLRTLKTNCKQDTIVIPKNTLNSNLKDICLEDINSFYNTLREDKGINMIILV